MLLVVDNGSTYTENLLDHLLNKKIEFSNMTFDDIDVSKLDKFSSFILSGRRTNDKKMNVINSKIIRYSISSNKSLLGICYGAEILALALGGTIKKMSTLHTGENEVSIEQDNPLCSRTINVFESHRYEISNLATLQCIARSDTCDNEIVQYKSKIFGTQFHPEMTLDGQNIIENFCAL